MAFNLGTALGGFMGGYNQQQQSQATLDALRLALQERQRQSAARGLAFEALRSGALRNAFSNLSGGIPASGFPMSSAPPVPQYGFSATYGTPMPGQASTATPSGPVSNAYGFPTVGNELDRPGGTNANYGQIDTPGDPGGHVPGYTPVDPSESGYTVPEPTGPAVEGTYTPTLPGDYGEMPIRPSGGGVPSETQMKPPAGPAQKTAEAGGSSSSNAPDQAPAPMPDPPQTTSPLDISRFFHQVDPQQLAEAVLQARPGADPETAMMAVEELFKMGTQGSQLERAQTALILQALARQQASTDRRYGIDTRAGTAAAAETGRNVRAGQASTDRRYGIDTRAGTAATQEAGRERRADQSEAGKDRRAGAAEAGKQSRFDQRQQDRAKANATAAQKAEMAAVETQIRNANARINQLQVAPTIDEKAIKQAMKDRDLLVERYDKMVERLLGKPAQ